MAGTSDAAGGRAFADQTPTLRTRRLVLRPWTEADAPDLMGAFGSDEAMRHWNAPPARTADDLARDIARSRAAPPASHAAWAVVLPDARGGGRAVGMVNYHDRDARNRRLSIGFILDPAHRGRGLAREAVGALLDHCFGALGAHRAEAAISPDNAASIRLVGRLGFAAEGGPLRDRLLVADGRWMSVLLFGLLDEEWRGRAVVSPGPKPRPAGDG